MIEFAGIEARNLRIDSFAVQPGMTMVIGTNGSGKTTLLEICCGLRLPDAGTVLVDGRNPRTIDAALVPAFPGPALLFSRVTDELASTGRFAGVPPRDVDRRVTAAAEATGTRHLLGRSTRFLSGGERFAVSLAAAIAGSPAVLVLDEFDGVLDRASLATILPAVRGSGARYILCSTHDPELAGHADHVIALEDGRITATGADALALFAAWEDGS